MKPFLLTACLFISIASAAPQKITTSADKATKLLVQSYKLYSSGDYQHAAAIDMQVFKLKGLPDDIYSVAFIQMGNIALSTGDLDVARLAYTKVVGLKGAPPQDKKAARLGLKLIDDIKSDQIKKNKYTNA